MQKDMRFLPLLLLLCVVLPFLGKSQGSKVVYFTANDEMGLRLKEDTLGILAMMMNTDTMKEVRFATTQRMIPTLVRALQIRNSYFYKFERLKTVSIQYAPDSTFRIFTWQLFVNNDEYRYYGAIQMKGSTLKLFPLVDRSFKITDPQQAVLSKENWYGSIYYNIKMIDSPEGKRYLLFGYDAYSFFRRRKIIDVLTFKNGEPVFGAPIFPVTVSSPQPVKRFVLEYSADASVKLNYDAALGMIVFDHLIPMSGQHNEGPTNVPDGSYEAFKIQKDKLVYLDKLPVTVQKDAPRPSPVLDTRDKKIPGTPKKNR
jgi:hypothetical protein